MDPLAFCLNIFFPQECLSCKRAGSFLCSRCLSKVSWQLRPYAEEIFFFAYLHEGWMRHAVHSLKYGGITGMFKECIARQAEVVRSWAAPYGEIIWVPVPVSKKRLQERGYNQAEILARQFARVGGGKVVAGALGKKELPSLVGQNRAQRQQQAREQFFWRGKQLPTADTYVIVDDVITTGSTLRACQALLQENVAGKVVGLALAHEQYDKPAPK